MPTRDDLHVPTREDDFREIKRDDIEILIFRTPNVDRGTTVAVRIPSEATPLVAVGTEYVPDQAFVRIFFREDMPGIEFPVALSRFEMLPLLEEVYTVADFPVNYDKVVKLKVNLSRHLRQEEIAFQREISLEGATR